MKQGALNEASALYMKLNTRMLQVERKLKAKVDDSAKDREDSTDDGSVDKTTVNEDADKQHGAGKHYNKDFRKQRREAHAKTLKELLDLRYDHVHFKQERDSALEACDLHKKEINDLQTKLNKTGTELLRAKENLQKIRDNQEQTNSLLK